MIQKNCKISSIVILFLFISSNLSLSNNFDINQSRSNFKFQSNPQNSAPINVTRLFSIIVGISDYYGSNNDLHYSSSDAQKFYDLLTNDYGCSYGDTSLFVNSNATFENIINKIDEISSEIDDNDKLLFYFTGRGMVDDPDLTNYSVNIETTHDYGSYEDIQWKINHTGAIGIRVHFSRFQTENFYDYLDIGDISEVGSSIYQKRYTGNLGSDFWSEFIPTFNDSISLNFRSNTFTADWGFQIDKYQNINTSSTSQGICPVDYNFQNFSNFINESMIEMKINSINCSQKYLFFDSSFSGGIIENISLENSIAISATKSTEFYLEDDNSESGCFSQFVFDSFDPSLYSDLYENKIDSNADGFNSIEEIFNYINYSAFTRSVEISPLRSTQPQNFFNYSNVISLFPAIFPKNISVSGYDINYSFFIDGISEVNDIKFVIWNSFDNDFVTYALNNSGYNEYNGTINHYKKISSIGIISNISTFQNWSYLIYQSNHSDYDNDNLTDIYEYTLGSDLKFNDTDNDKLLDFDEILANTDISNNDTDSDNIPDGWEIFYELNPLSGSDNESDPDFDYIWNIYEFTNGTNPKNIDTDGDNMPDGYEIDFFLNPTDFNDKFEDPDLDGMANYYECWNSSTNPLNPDSDYDGINDYWELYNGTKPWDNDTDNDFLSDGDEIKIYSTNPRNEDSDFDFLIDGREILHTFTDVLNNDTDYDGLIDGYEIDLYYTNATNPDHDGDGILDGEEVFTGTDGYITNPKNIDTDGDSFNDNYEIFWGTDPTDPESAPVLVNQLIIGGIVVIGLIGLIIIGKVEKKIRNERISNTK